MDINGQRKPLRVELGCGANKKEGFFGIDVEPLPGVDKVMNIEKTPLPFEDNSVDYIYSSHTFEHLTDFPYVFREIFRVCKPGAIIEIWTPYGKSNDGLLYGHFNFFTETHFKHVCFEYDRFFLCECPGYFSWEKTHYILFPKIIRDLRMLNIPLVFAREHLFNIILEWGVFLTVRKDAERAPGVQAPEEIYSYGREQKPLLKLDHKAGPMKRLKSKILRTLKFW
jgi:SAM-dependent methyltransferase